MLLLVLVEYQIEGGGEQEREERACDYPSGECHGQRLHHLRSVSGEEGHRDHSQDRRERSHQDRPQASVCRLQAGLLDRYLLLHKAVDAVDEDDSVVYDNADERDYSHDREERELLSHEDMDPYHADQEQRDGGEDDERVKQ